MLESPQLTDFGGRPAGGDRGTALALEAASWLYDRRRFVAGSTVLGAALAYAASFLIAPSYVATTSLYVDLRTPPPLASSAPDQGDNNAQVSFVESQAKIIVSQSVLARVVAAEGLADDPAFTGRSGLLARILAPLIGSRPTPTAAVRERTALLALADRVSVRRPERTFIIDVSVEAPEPDTAARLANAVASAYSDEQAARHAAVARQASDALTGRLDDLRGRLQRSEDQVQLFKEMHRLVGTRVQLNSEQQLTDANAQLAQARIQRVQSLARLQELSRPTGSSTAEADTPEATSSPTVTLLRGKQADAERQLQLSFAQFGARHPAMRDARDQLSSINRALRAEYKRLRGAAEVDYQRAAVAENEQKQIVDKLSSDAAETGGALAKLSQLQGEVDINRNLLNTFLTRAHEMGELEQIDPVSARIISRADPPLNRAWPPRGIVFLVLGALLGFWIAATRVIVARTHFIRSVRRAIAAGAIDDQRFVAGGGATLTDPAVRRSA